MATTLIPFTFLSSKALRNILPILPKPFIATLILLPILYCYHDEDVFKVFCLLSTLVQSICFSPLISLYSLLLLLVGFLYSIILLPLYLHICLLQEEKNIFLASNECLKEESL